MSSSGGDDSAVDLRRSLAAEDSPRLRVIRSGVFGGYEDTARELAAELLAARGDDTEPSPGCPVCGGTLEHGSARVHGSLARFLLVGFSWQTLYFRADGSTRDQEIVGSAGRTAARCEDCLTLFVSGG